MEPSGRLLMTLRRVPHLTVTWAHQSAPCPSKDHNAPSTPSNDDLHHPQPVMGSSWVLTGSRDSLAQQQYSHYGHGAPTPANLPGVDRTNLLTAFPPRRKQNAGAAAERVRRPGATHPLYNRNSSAPQTYPSTPVKRRTSGSGGAKFGKGHRQQPSASSRRSSRTWLRPALFCASHAAFIPSTVAAPRSACASPQVGFLKKICDLEIAPLYAVKRLQRMCIPADGNFQVYFQRSSRHSPHRSAPSNACSACASPQMGISKFLFSDLQDTYSPHRSAPSNACSAYASPQMGIFKFLFSDLQDTYSPRPFALSEGHSACVSPQVGIFKIFFPAVFKVLTAPLCTGERPKCMCLPESAIFRECDLQSIRRDCYTVQAMAVTRQTGEHLPPVRCLRTGNPPAPAIGTRILRREMDILIASRFTERLFPAPHLFPSRRRRPGPIYSSYATAGGIRGAVEEHARVRWANVYLHK
ncbi:hypothetical protein B0H16DRAFT_1724222 [Mycena metata]|uniref:Uncharacterized protein n=1 Tax=Mycena metata TaxID=1033252 RepID=A0AAD7N8B2_9AGAR|nr:hypothetical protein B0H16DRAFT_1724222 [Mycena metata]